MISFAVIGRLFKGVFGGIPWQAWVAGIVAGCLVGMVYLWHGAVLDRALDNMRNEYEKQITEANNQKAAAVSAKNVAIDRMDDMLSGRLRANTDDADNLIKEVMERIDARYKAQGSDGCFIPIDELRMPVTAKRVR